MASQQRLLAIQVGTVGFRLPGCGLLELFIEIQPNATVLPCLYAAGETGSCRPSHDDPPSIVQSVGSGKWFDSTLYAGSPKEILRLKNTVLIFGPGLRPEGYGWSHVRTKPTVAKRTVASDSSLRIWWWSEEGEVATVSELAGQNLYRWGPYLYPSVSTVDQVAEQLLTTGSQHFLFARMDSSAVLPCVTGIAILVLHCCHACMIGRMDCVD